MDKVALEFARRYIVKKYMKIWQDFVIEERLLYWDKENRADEQNDKYVGVISLRLLKIPFLYFNQQYTSLRLTDLNHTSPQCLKNNKEKSYLSHLISCFILKNDFLAFLSFRFRRLLRKAMKYWKKYIPLLREEEKREKRRNDLRKHVSSLLPDFQALHNSP